MITRHAEPAPLSELNTTPLIDVMLVLLIMFIITIPPQSDAVTIDLPAGPPPLDRPINPIRNTVVVTAAGAILWNGGAVSQRELGRLLAASQRVSPPPELHLKPEPDARYGTVDEVLAITKRAAVANMGFVGNERYRAAF